MKEIYEKIIFAGIVIYVISATTFTSGQVAGVILALIGWIGRMIMTKRFEITGTPLNMPILLFIIALFLATIFSPYPLESLSATESIIRKIALYYLVVCGIKDLSMAKRLIAILLIAASIEAIYIICQYFWGFKLFGIIIHDGVSKGLIYNRALGGALGIILPVGISFFLFSQNFYRRIIFGLISLLISLLLLLTSTRGAWMGVAIAIGFIGIFKARKILLFIILVLILLFFISPKQTVNRSERLPDRLLSIFKYENNLCRMYLFRDTLKIIKDNPLFGIGPGNFKKVYYSKYLSSEISALKEFGHKHCHNNFLNVAVEGGLLGLGAFIWLIIASFCLSFKILKTAATEIFPLILGLFGGLITWLVHGMVDCTYIGGSAYLFWFILGMIILLGRAQGEQSLSGYFLAGRKKI